MKGLNNVDLDRVKAFGEEMKKTPAKARKTQVIEGEWNVKEGWVQFRSAIQFEGRKAIFEADNPTFMGGGCSRWTAMRSDELSSLAGRISPPIGQRSRLNLSKATV